MTGQVVPVTAHWALWGTQADSTGRRVLASSAGGIDAVALQDVLARYSPGTLHALPQVTIGWFGGGERRGFVAIAVYDQHEFLAAGVRQAVLARLFCVPYDELAAGSVAYSALYQALREFRQPASDRRPISVELPTSDVPADCSDHLAMRVAALLVSGKPVCILGADRVGMEERLRFIDAVASLLPFGLRSRLSASTWASSTAQAHKLRLFFASAPRVGDRDHMVTWGRRVEGPIGHEAAEQYLRLLGDGTLRPATLAAYRDQLDFGSKSIDGMLRRLTVRGEPRMTEQAPPRIPAPSSGTVGANVDEVLRLCCRALDGDSAGLRSAADQLRAYSDEPQAPEQRLRILNLIGDFELFRPNPPVDERVLVDFYVALLRLAFATPLSYHAHCLVEDCAGARGGPMHQALYGAMRRVGLKGGALLLVLAAVSPENLHRAVRDGALSPDALMSIAADPRLLPRHFATVCAAIVRLLQDQPGGAQRLALKEALSQRAYLAAVLEERLPGDLDRQVGMLRQLLAAAHGGRLPRAEVQSVFGGTGGVPTDALLAAGLLAVAEQDAVHVLKVFAGSVVGAAGFGEAARRELDRLIQGADLLAASGSLPVQAAHRGRFRWRR